MFKKIKFNFAKALPLILTLSLFTAPVAISAGTPTFTVPTSPVTLNEQTPTQVFPGLTFVDAGTNYSGGWIEYAVDTSTANDSLTFETSTVASTTLDSITVVGSTVFKGTGTSATAIGTIDGVKNGLNGNNLRISFSNTFTNGNFSINTATTAGDVVSMTGWTAYKSRVKLAGGSTVESWPTPTDGAFPARTDGTSPYDVSTATNTYTVDPSYLGRDGTGYSVQLATNGSCGAGFCIIRGPYIVSNDPVYLGVGDSVSFYWSALGASDAYDVYGYLLNTSNGSTIELLNATGANGAATQSWTQVTTTIGAGKAGTYKFVFIAGTWDASGGRAEGASLLLDDVSVSSSAPATITDLDLQALSRLLKYEETSDAPVLSKRVTVSTNTSAVGGVQTLSVTAVNDPITLQTPSSITRLKSMTDSSTATGTLYAYDPDTGVGTPISASYGISGGASGPGAHQVYLEGQYGKLIVDTSTGSYSYQFFVDTVTALTENASETFTVTATDGVDTPTAYLVINLTLAPDGSAARTLAFTVPSPLNISRNLGETFTVTAIPSRGVGDGTITYSIGSSTSCTILGTTVTITSITGTCTVSASISTGTYYAAASTTSSVTVTFGAAAQKEPEISSPSFVNIPTYYGTQGQSMNVSVTANNAVTYEIKGSLLGGLTLNAATGQISGIPTVFGTFHVVVIARNQGGGTEATFIFMIMKSAPSLEALTPILNKGANPYVTLNNVELDSIIRANTSQNGIEVIAPGWTLGLSAMQDDGKAAPLSPKQSILLKDNQQVYIGGTGFKANSEVRVYIFSTAKLLGTTITDAKGEFSGIYPMIKDIEEGDHQIQVNGLSPENDLRSATLPAIYQTSKSNSSSTSSLVLVVPFAFNKYALGQSQVSLLKKIQKSNATKIKVVGYAQPSKNQPDIALSLDRAIEVKKTVSKLIGISQISIEGQGSKKNALCEAYKNKCVVIYVKG